MFYKLDNEVGISVNSEQFKANIGVATAILQTNLANNKYGSIFNCVQITQCDNKMSFSTSNGREMRSWKWKLTEGNHSDTTIFVDRKKLLSAANHFTLGDNVSPVDVRIDGVSGVIFDNSKDILLIPKLDLPQEVDLFKISQETISKQKPSDLIPLPVANIQKVINKFDYRKNRDAREVVLDSPNSGQLRISQRDNDAEFIFNIGNEGSLKYPVAIYQKLLKNFVNTVGNSQIIFGQKNRLMPIYVCNQNSSFEALIMAEIMS